MEIKSKIGAALTTGLLCVGIIQAQQSVNASGSVATGIEGSFAYSVGQIVYTTQFSNSGSLSQGVQQPYEIFRSDTRDAEQEISILLFPNPTADYLVLETISAQNGNITCALYDFNGKLLSEKQIVEKQTRIEMGELPTSTYFITLINKDNKAVQSFKIIKN